MAEMLYNPLAVGHTRFVSKTRDGGSLPTNFEAFLYKPFEWGQLKLTIVLGIKLKQKAFYPFAYDANTNNNAFLTSPWTTATWQTFLADAKAQADLWNNKFWIRPSTTFSEYDFQVHGFPGQARRPYIRCELRVDFDPAVEVRKPIEVANLDRVILVAQGQTVDAGTFRDHSLLWDSLDGTPWVRPLGVGPNLPQAHPVIAHELGHLLGLGHIGVIRKTPLCVYAQNLAELGLGERVQRPLEGGSNADACYGLGQDLHNTDNIMGAGDKFTVENGRPWLWAIQSILTKHVGWSIVTSDPGDGFWVKRN